MITVAIDRPERTRIACIEMTAENRIAAAPTLSTRNILAANEPVGNLSPPVGARFDGEPSIVMPVVISEWTPQLEKEFSELADRVIEDQLPPAERHRFGQLTMLRRRLHHPRPVAEILYEQERTELLVDLVTALSRCVKFIDANGQNFTRTGAEEKNSAT